MSSSAAPAASSAVEQIGIFLAQQLAQPAEEGVRVAHLRGALALPRAEGGGRIGRVRLGVALEDRHPRAAVGKHARRGEAGDAGRR